MCGIVGFISGESSLDALKNVFSQLLVVDSMRGMESTGVALVAPDLETTVYKRALDGMTFIGTEAYDPLIYNHLPTARIAIGHNRAATKGSIKDKNAHPFQEGGFTVAHNGHISNAWALTNKSRDKLEVDSMVIPEIFAARGEKAGLEALNGAFSLAWWNSEDKTFNLARNTERPMTFGFLEKHNIMVFGSEHLMLSWILGRNHLDVKDNKFFHTKIGVHYKFNPINPKGEAQRIPFSLAPRHQGTIGGGAVTGTTTKHQTSPVTSITRSTACGERDTTPATTYYEKICEQTNIKTIRSQCWAVGAKQIKKAAVKIATMGLGLGSCFFAKFGRYEPYGKQQKNGRLLGFRIGRADTECEIANVSADAAEKIMKEKEVWVRVVNAKNSRDVSGKVRLITTLTPPAPLLGVVHTNRFNKHMMLGPNNTRITVEQWRVLTEEGCAVCKRNIPFSVADSISWVNNMPLCMEHSGSNNVLNALGIQILNETTH